MCDEIKVEEATADEIAAEAVAETVAEATPVEEVAAEAAPEKPDSEKTFDELLEVTYVTVKAILESGLEKPFVNRGPETVYKD